MNVQGLRGWWRGRKAKHQSPFEDEFMARLKAEQKAVRDRNRRKVRPQRRRLALKMPWPDEHAAMNRAAAESAVQSRSWADSDHQNRIRQPLPFDRPVFNRHH